jgi:hypothetical protein
MTIAITIDGGAAALALQSPRVGVLMKDKEQPCVAERIQRVQRRRADGARVEDHGAARQRRHAALSIECGRVRAHVWQHRCVCVRAGQRRVHMSEGRCGGRVCSAHSVVCVCVCVFIGVPFVGRRVGVRACMRTGSAECHCARHSSDNDVDTTYTTYTSSCNLCDMMHRCVRVTWRGVPRLSLNGVRTVAMVTKSKLEGAVPVAAAAPLPPSIAPPPLPLWPPPPPLLPAITPNMSEHNSAVKLSRTASLKCVLQVSTQVCACDGKPFSLHKAIFHTTNQHSHHTCQA